MKRLASLAALALLAACQPAPTAANDVRHSEPTVVELPLGFKKFCDMGRAIYVQNGVKESAIAIVENAPECA